MFFNPILFMWSLGFNVVFLGWLLNRTLSDDAPDTFRCTFNNRKDSMYTFNTEDDEKLAFSDCLNATSITLTTGDTLVSTSYHYKYLDLLFTYSNATLDMCVAIIHTAQVFISVFVPEIKGTCEGPKLIIVNNSELLGLELGANLLNSFMGSLEKEILVRGNRKLQESTLRNLSKYAFIDVQGYGECLLPSEIGSLSEIAFDNCSTYYGPLTIDSQVKSILLPPYMKSKYKWTGCVQIENTKLENAEFLRMFSSFSLIPGCEHYIRGNKRLCLTKELDFIYSLFAGIEVSDNKDSCQSDCIGGAVTDDYLRNMGNCAHVHGDLSISKWKGKPPTVHVLRGIKSIKGRLIISDNRGLGKFDYFSSLEKVEPLNGSHGFLVIVENNPDLAALPMPKLKGIEIKENDPLVKLVNNPLLFNKPSSMMTARPMSTMLHRQAAPESTIMEDDSKANLRWEYVLAIAAILILLILVVAVVLIVLLMRSHKKKRSPDLPSPTTTLSKKSKKSLASMSEEITSKDPFLWNECDGELLWTSGRSRGGADVKSKRKEPKESLKALMIPLAVNARLPVKRGDDSDKHLSHRIRELSAYDYVVMVGKGGDVSKVVPRLPNAVAASSIYNDPRGGVSYSYKLVEKHFLAPRIIYHKYEVTNSKKHSIKSTHLMYYDWQEDRLPTEFDGVLRILHLCLNKKTICVSDRRKEVFSLLYLLFRSVWAGKQMRMTELLQYHLRNCNGAPLDRDEMLYAFRTIIRWAQQVSCISKSDKQSIKWCKDYDCMAEFANAHPNIRNIYREYLRSTGGETYLREPLGSNRCRRKPFEERPRVNMLMAKPSPEMQSGSRGSEQRSSSAKSPKTAILRIDSRIEPVKRDSREEEELPKQDSKGEPAKQDSKEAQAREDSKGEPAQKSPHQARKGSDEPSLSTENDEEVKDVKVVEEDIIELQEKLLKDERRKKSRQNVDIKAKPRKRRSFLGFEKRKPGRTPRKESELHTMQENTHRSNYVESENPA